jgi:alpha-beta hydrolase superfamily lysophospholipase
MVHGTADVMTSYAASKEAFEKLQAKDKKYISFDGGFHERTQIYLVS